MAKKQNTIIERLKEEWFIQLCRCRKAEDALQEAEKSKQFWFNRYAEVEDELNEVKARLAKLETKDDIDLTEGA